MHVFLSSTGTTQVHCSISLMDDAFKTLDLERTFIYCGMTKPSLSFPPHDNLHIILYDDDGDEPPRLAQQHYKVNSDPPPLQPRSELIGSEEVHIIPLKPVVPPETTPLTRPPSLIDPLPVHVSPDPSTLVDQFPLPTMPTHVDEVADDLAILAMTP